MTDKRIERRQQRGQAAREKKQLHDDADYMSHLGGGTGVDIGPGAAGEMSDTAGPKTAVSGDKHPQ